MNDRDVIGPNECKLSRSPYGGHGKIGTEQRCPECGRSVRIINGLFTGGAWAMHDRARENQERHTG